MQNSKQNRFFSGYVREPGPMVFIITIVGILTICVAVLCTVLLNNQYDPHSLQSITIQISHLKITENTIQLHTDEGIFSVPNDLVCDYPVLQNSVADHTEFLIHYRPFKKNNEVKGTVWALSDSSGIIHVNEETVREYQKDSYRMMAKTSWIIVVIYSVFTLCLWYFLCNASKYPRVAVLFVRKQWRNF